MSIYNGLEMSIKDYAAKRGKTVQAVYQQMKRKENAAALAGHVFTKRIGNKDVKYLDEKAIEVLDNGSNNTPTVIIQDDLKLALEEANQKNKELEAAAWKQQGQIELLLRQLADKDKELQQLSAPQAIIDGLEAQIADLSDERDFYIQKAAESKENENKALQELTEAHESFEAELKKRDEQIQELENRKWYQLLFKKHKE